MWARASAHVVYVRLCSFCGYVLMFMLHIRAPVFMLHIRALVDFFVIFVIFFHYMYEIF